LVEFKSLIIYDIKNAMKFKKTVTISTGFLILQWLIIALLLLISVVYLWHYGLPPLRSRIDPIETVFQVRLEGIAEKEVRGTKLYDVKVTLKLPDDKENAPSMLLWIKDQQNTDDLVEKLKSGHIYLVRPEPKTQLVYVGRPKQPYLNVKTKGDRMEIVTNDPDVVVPYSFKEK